MNIKRSMIAAALLTSTTGVANAIEPAHGNLYYIPQANLDVTVPGFGSGDDDGDGFGGNLYLPLGATQNFVITGEYQTVEYDETEIELDQFRVGGGFQAPAGMLSWAVLGEYVNADFDDAEMDGLGVHARLTAPVADRARIYGQVGYLMLEDDYEDIDGVEYLIGASFDFTPQVGAFVDLRTSDLEGEDSGVETEFQDFRVGMRVLFGSMM